MSFDGDVPSLVDRARTGDRAAFGRLAFRYEKPLSAVVRRHLGSGLEHRLEVNDILQETFLRAFAGIGRFEPQGDGSFFRWLSGIAVRVILEAANRGSYNRVLFIQRDLLSEGPTASQAARRRERFDRFEQALSGLSADYTTAIRLVRLDGLSIREAAARMGRSPNAVSKLIIRGLRKLRAAFGDTETFHLEFREGDGDGRAGGG
jgi:RNA polymerase sigma factor (sigma-70 family)